MKKSFKLIPVALGLLTLASCSNEEDFVDKKQAVNNDNLIVRTEAQFDGDALTRSAVGYARVETSSGKKGTLWGTFFLPGDQIKVYGTESWKYQVWEKNGDAPESAGNVVDNAFDLKKVLTADATEDDELFGFDKVGFAVYPSDLSVFANEERSEITITNFIDDDGTINLEVATDGENAYEYPVSSKYTDLNTKNLFACNVPLWGKAADGKCDMKNLAGLMKIVFQGKEITAGQKIVLTSSGTENLYGNATVTGFNYDEDVVPQIENTDLTGGTTLTIVLPALTGDNYILVPIPVGTYSSLKVAYVDTDDSELASETYTSLVVEPGFFKKDNKAFYALTVSEAEEIDDAEVIPETIQNAISDNYADFGRNVTIDVTHALKVGNESNVDKIKVLDLTGVTLKNDVVVNLNAGIIAYNTGDETAKLAIKGGEGTGKLIINVPNGQTSAAAIDASQAGVNVEINYANTTPLSKDVTINAKATLKGHFASVIATEDVTIADGVEITTLAADTKNVTIDGGVVGSITTTGNATVTKGNVTTIEAADVTINDATVGTVTATGDVELKNAKVTTLNVTDGEITIDNLEADNVLEKEIETLNISGNATLNLDNGFVKAINITGDETAPTIVSKGKSAIADVTNEDKATITSEWDGVTYKGISNVGAYKAYWENAEIYTASQLASLRTNKGMHLFADIDLNENAWNGKTIARSFNGHNHTISNVKLAETAKGFFNALTESGGSTGSVADLIIDGITAEGTLTATGALFGTIGYTTTIDNVQIKNAAISGDEASYDLGGLVGVIDGIDIEVTVTNTIIDADVAGYYNLGVVIGRIGNGSVVLGATDKHVSVDKTSSVNVVKDLSAKSKDAKAGKAAIVVGELNGKLHLAAFSSSLTSSSINADTDLYYNKQRITIDDEDMYFKGNLSGSNAQYFVGYSPAAIEYKKGTTVYTKCYDGGETYTAATKNAYNVFQ